MAAQPAWAGVLWGTAAMLMACAPATQTPTVGRAVTESIDAIGRTRVLVTLRDPVGSTAPAAERAVAVAATQEALLRRLPSGEFTVVRRYRNVPGLALVISRKALDVLRTDSSVASVEIDEVGGASGAPPHRAD